MCSRYRDATAANSSDDVARSIELRRDRLPMVEKMWKTAPEMQEARHYMSARPLDKGDKLMAPIVVLPLQTSSVMAETPTSKTIPSSRLDNSCP